MTAGMSAKDPKRTFSLWHVLLTLQFDMAEPMSARDESGKREHSVYRPIFVTNDLFKKAARKLEVLPPLAQKNIPTNLVTR
jgi:hypothetical protein